MENRGQVNRYVPYKWSGGSICTINLAAGTTPFILFEGGREYCSAVYVLDQFEPLGQKLRVKVTLGWYRPGRPEFDAKSKDLQDHVLNGGLLHLPLADAVAHQLAKDPVDPSWEYEQFQQWAEIAFGRRFPSKPR